MKDNLPPHDEIPNAKNIPAKTNLIAEIFPWLNFNPETKRYIAKKAKNSPSGSDLYHPIKPLEKIGTETENINAANNPAEVPPNTRTKANTSTPVNEPIIKGNNTVKS